MVVTSVRANSTNQAIIPIVSTSKNITIASIISSATIEAIIPIVSTSKNIIIASIISSATIEIIIPIIVLSASIVALVANCTSQSKVPLISAIKNISESIRKPVVQAIAASHIINQLSRRIRTEVM